MIIIVLIKIKVEKIYNFQVKTFLDYLKKVGVRMRIMSLELNESLFLPHNYNITKLVPYFYLKNVPTIKK